MKYYLAKYVSKTQTISKIIVVNTEEELQGKKELGAMELEEHFDEAFRCVEVKEWEKKTV